MRNSITIEARRFPLLVWNVNAGKVENAHVVISKQQLQAAQIIGESSKEIIERLCKRQGMTLLEVGEAERKSIVLEMSALWEHESQCAGGLTYGMRDDT